MNEEITNDRVIQLFTICRLYFAGKYDFVKYNGKSRSFPKMNIRLNAIARKLIKEFETEWQITRHFAITLFYDKSCYTEDIASDSNISRSKKILNDLTSAEQCVNMLDLDTFVVSINEKDGQHAQMLTWLIGKKISPVSFVAIDLLTGMTNHWSSPLWEINKSRISCLSNLLCLPTEFIESFRKQLRGALNNIAG